MKAPLNAVLIRQVPLEKIKKYLSDKNFNYNSETPEGDGLSGRIFQWLSEHFFGPVLHTVLTYWTLVYYIILALLLGLLVYFLRKGELNRLFYNNGLNEKNFSENMEEDIHLLNFDTLIAATLSNGQFRLSVRYLYLQILRTLSDRNLILWQVNKTNFDYLKELKNPAYNQLFKETTTLFNHVWYGDVALTEQQFYVIKNAFDRFNNQIKTGSEKPQ